MPPGHLLRERLDALLAVVYLIFNAGYSGRDELAAEAIWLGRALTELLPDDPETRGLLAMMLLHDSAARRGVAAASSCCSAIRTGHVGTPRRPPVAAPNSTRLSPLGGGPYVLQAAIASLHARCRATGSRSPHCTGSSRLTASPVVELNRAIAIAETEGAEAGLCIVDGVGLDDLRYLHSTRAELLRRLGRTDETRDAYRRAREPTAVPNGASSNAG